LKSNVRFVAIVAALTSLMAFGAPVALAQTGTSAETNPSHPSHRRYVELANVPEKARAKRNPLASGPDALAAGGKLFEQHCSECHGMKAEGTKRGPSLRSEPIRQATPGTLFWILSNGVVRRGMPDWSKLPEPQRWQLVTFIKALGSASVESPEKK
jgi:mono/diheme cytochrome c family protein